MQAGQVVGGWREEPGHLLDGEGMTGCCLKCKKGTKKSAVTMTFN